MTQDKEPDYKKLYTLLRTMIDHAPDLIWAKDLEKKHLIVNQANCDKLLLCQTPKEAEGKDHLYFANRERRNNTPYTFGETCEDSDDVVMQTARPGRFLEDGIVRGKYLALDVNKAPIFDESGRMTGIVGCGRDVTEEIRIKKETDQLKDQLRQSQKMEAIGTLAGGIAHDLNNILQAVSAQAETLFMEKDPADPDHGQLVQIHESAQQGGELIRQLLLFSRKARVLKQPVRINQAVKSAVQLLKRTIPRMIDIQSDLKNDLPDIHADPVQIQQVLLNIGANAVQAMPDGGTLGFRTSVRHIAPDRPGLESELAPGEYVTLTISDSGKGMDKKTRERIFDPFFTTKEKGQGTGLGLASVYGIVEAHSGRVTCTSSPGNGSSFDLFFPAMEKTAAPRPAEPAACSNLHGRNETILVVDDEEYIRIITAQALSRFSYRVITADSGEAAVQIYKAEKPDLVLLDLSMPGMGGEQCMDRILRLNPEARIILASGYFDTTESMEADTRRPDFHFIQKPYRLKELAGYVKNVLDT